MDESSFAADSVSGGATVLPEIEVETGCGLPASIAIAGIYGYIGQLIYRAALEVGVPGSMATIRDANRLTSEVPIVS